MERRARLATQSAEILEFEPRVYSIADEDLDRENDEKTSAGHFMRFEVTPSMRVDLSRDAAFAIGVDHPAYLFALREVPDATRRALVADLSNS